MIILHAKLNARPKSGPALKVEFVYNNGYFAKWYEAKNAREAREALAKDPTLPNAKYLRSKKY